MNKLLTLALSAIAAATTLSAATPATINLGIAGEALDEGDLTGIMLLPKSRAGGNIPDNDLLLADPTIYTENGRYYVSGTSLGDGFRMYESANLHDWALVSNDADSYTLRRDRGIWGTGGFWAPQYYKNGENDYWLAYVANEQCVIAKSPTLTGLYQQEVQQPVDASAHNIDPFIFRDDDGKYYMYHVRFDGGNILYVGELDPETLTIKPGTLKCCFRNTQAWEATNAYPSSPIMEGPTVIKIDDLYYLFYSANHYLSTDYAVGYATAPSPTGPWTKYAGNPIIHRNIVGELGSGHGDIFFDNEGKMRYVYHVHHDNANANPRRTRIIDFNIDKSEGQPYKISCDPNTIIRPGTNGTSVIFSGFARLKPGKLSIVGYDSKGDPFHLGIDGQSFVEEGGEDVEVTEAGVYMINVDTRIGKVELTRIEALNVVGNVAPEGTTLDYAGNGVWKSEITLESDAATPYAQRAIHFNINGDESNPIGRRPNTQTAVLKSNNAQCQDIRINPGTYTVTLDLNGLKYSIEAETDPARITMLGTDHAVVHPDATTFVDLLGNNLKELYDNGEIATPLYISPLSLANSKIADLGNRFIDVTQDHGQFVILSTTLTDEGLADSNSTTAISNTVTENRKALVERIEAEDRIAIVTNTLPIEGITRGKLNTIRQFNLNMQTGATPSVNLFGAVDDGTGFWADKAFADGAITLKGHQLLASAFVPSSFEALTQGKPAPARDVTGRFTLGHNESITFTPEGNLGSFSLSMLLSGTTDNLLIINHEPATLKINADGSVTFGTQTSKTQPFADGKEHYLIITHYAGSDLTLVYADATEIIRVENELTGDIKTFGIGSVNSDTQEFSISELAFWRSAISSIEISRFVKNAILGSSLEILTPFTTVDNMELKADESNPEYVSALLPNKAQSLNAAAFTRFTSGIESATINSASLATPTDYFTPDGRKVAATQARDGIYLVRYTDGTVRKLKL